MDRSSVLLVVLISIFASVLAQTSSVDCTKRPMANPNDIKNCCKRPSLNIDKYKTMCYNQTAANTNPHAYMDPCGVECIFTKSGALNNGVFNYTNIQSLFKTVMPTDPDLAKLFLTGFKVCEPEVQEKMKVYNSRKVKLPGRSPCSPMAVTASFCAMRYVFVNCPSNLWTPTDVCNQAQTYLKNCDPSMGPSARMPVG